jgi:hypothetical protein
MPEREPSFPFAGELREQHDALRATLRWFQAELEGTPAGRLGCAPASEFLRVFREQLVEHFRFEELSGFEGGASSPDSEIQNWTAELMRQHRALDERLQGLRRRLAEQDQQGAVPVPLRAELRAFFSALRRHDAEENALILWISQGPTDFVRHPETY